MEEILDQYRAIPSHQHQIDSGVNRQLQINALCWNVSQDEVLCKVGVCTRCSKFGVPKIGPLSSRSSNRNPHSCLLPTSTLFYLLKLFWVQFPGRPVIFSHIFRWIIARARSDEDALYITSSLSSKWLWWSLLRHSMNLHSSNTETDPYIRTSAFRWRLVNLNSNLVLAN